MTPRLNGCVLLCWSVSPRIRLRVEKLVEAGGGHGEDTMLACRRHGMMRDAFPHAF